MQGASKLNASYTSGESVINSSTLQCNVFKKFESCDQEGEFKVLHTLDVAEQHERYKKTAIPVKNKVTTYSY